jgi:hypothetical protein
MAELSKENPLQREAFEIYYQMGDKRSLKAVAEKVDRTERSVAGWSRTFNWVDRVSQREIEEAKYSDNMDEILAQTVASKTSYRIMISNLMKQVSRKIARGELAVRNIQDFERMVKLDLLLMGENTEKIETTGTNSTELSKADKERLDEIAKLLAGK